ncbi:HAD-IA family hydrolase [Candidatus Saccharibacteria bacterium]|nr:HAD-IA family hydrolase [Candidatus Saccharibacteria bacterium]
MSGQTITTRAVIFDCFGVLTESTYKKFYAHYLHNDPEKIQEAKRLDHLANMGTLSTEGLNYQFAALANISVGELQAFISQYYANTELLDYIAAHLKPRYKIGFLSNVASDLMDTLFTVDQQAIFDDVLLSYQVGMAKPAAEIFQLSAARLKVQPEECIFVDDIQQYCDAARAQGMRAITYNDFQDFKAELEALL